MFSSYHFLVASHQPLEYSPRTVIRILRMSSRCSGGCELVIPGCYNDWILSPWIKEEYGKRIDIINPYKAVY